jgi:hypothetical protein
LKEDHFPIENDDPSVDEKFQNEITNLNTQIPQVVEYLKETFNIVESDYIEILKRINLNTNQREVLKKKMYASFLLGEVIRKTVSGNWILLKQHGTFNPYFLPAILNKKHQVILLSPMSGLFFSDLEFAIDNFLKTPFITQPKLALNSPYFKNLYPEYIILE